jgi:hypothetical protein
MRHILDRLSLAAVAALFVPTAFAACDATVSTDRLGYREAVNQVRMLEEFKTWRAQLVAKRARAAFGFSVDKQQFVRGDCYWSVTIYSDEGSGLQHWKTFFVPTQAGEILSSTDTGKLAPIAPRQPRAATTRKSCRDEIGEQKAAALARRCREVSTATHPPCNAWNPCALIEREIRRNCRGSKATYCDGYSQ